MDRVVAVFLVVRQVLVVALVALALMLLLVLGGLWGVLLTGLTRVLVLALFLPVPQLLRPLLLLLFRLLSQVLELQLGSRHTRERVQAVVGHFTL